MNDRIYFRVENPKEPKHLKDGPAKRLMKNVITKILTSVLPKANPDFDHLIDSVEYWKIEFDTRENVAWKEIGFDIDDRSIVAMPFGNNYGFWCDSQLTLEDYENLNSTPISPEEFENDWTEFRRVYSIRKR